MPDIVLTLHYTIISILIGGYAMKKTTSISIRVSEEELDLFKKAADMEAYASYSEFVRRTALIEAARIVNESEKRKEGSNKK